MSEEPSRRPGAPPKLSPEEERLVADLVADGLSIQDQFRPEPLHKQNRKGHYPGGRVEATRKGKAESKRKHKI